MPRMTAPPIVLGDGEREVLERLERAHGTPQQVALRGRMILLAGDGVGPRETARRLGTWPKTVRRWRQRWLSGSADGDIARRLADAPRPGAPAMFTPQQVCAIIAIACEEPSASALPISHWSQQAIADEAMRRGVVETISQRSVGRFLKRIGAQAASGPGLADGQAGPAVR